MLLQKSHANDILSFTFKCNRSLTEKEALMDNLKTNVWFFFSFCVSLYQHIFCLKKNSIEKITKMSHNTVFFRIVFNAKCIFIRICAQVLMHLFIIKSLVRFLSLIHCFFNTQWILNHINLIIRNDHHKATKIFLSHKNPWAIFCVCT